MSESSIQQVSPNSTALNAEHYQSFEMAKANDGILGGDDIAQIRSYAAYARAQAQAIHKTIAATSGIDDVAAIKEEATETAQTFAKVGIYADQRIGEILRELPTRQGKRTDTSSTAIEEVTKAEALKESNISTPTAYQLEQLAANPEVVEAVIAKAEQDGRVVSRSQVLKAIKERDEARKDAEEVSKLYGKVVIQRDEAKEDLASERAKNLELGSQIANLRHQASEKPEPEVIEREVEVVREVVPEDVQRRMKSLEHEVGVYHDTDQRLRRQLENTRKELDRAKGILNMGESTRKVQNDVEYLIAATNQYVRNYGGLTWTFEQIADVDETTREELRKAVKNLATFSNALVAGLEQM